MTEPGAESSEQGAEPRWPTYLGTIGILIAGMTLVDQLTDLLVSGWTAAEWGRLLGADLGRTVADAVPPRGWLVVTALVGTALAILLLAASLALRRYRLRGVMLTRVWAWAAICWTLVGTASGLWLSQRLEVGLPAVAVWQPFVLIAVLLTVCLLFVYPIFLLVWLARPDVEKQWSTWS